LWNGRFARAPHPDWEWPGARNETRAAVSARLMPVPGNDHARAETPMKFDWIIDTIMPPRGSAAVR